MKAKASPLRLKHFELIESQFQFIVPEVEVIDDVRELFDTYSLEVDFSHEDLEDELIQVNCSVKVNKGRSPLAGYSMLADAIGVFEIQDSEELDEDKLGNLKFYSTLNMMINNLRNIIFQQSNLGPMKGYLLPPIDVLDLFEKKRKELERQKPKK